MHPRAGPAARGPAGLGCVPGALASRHLVFAGSALLRPSALCLHRASARVRTIAHSGAPRSRMLVGGMVERRDTDALLRRLSYGIRGPGLSRSVARACAEDVARRFHVRACIRLDHLSSAAPRRVLAP